MTELDPVIHAPSRLRVMAALSGIDDGDRVTFPWLRDTLEMTAGNLSVHLRKLEDAGYVSCRKSFAGRVPRTEYALTAKGRVALERYIRHMEDLIRATKGASR